MPKKLYTLLRNRLYTISRIGLGTLLRNIHYPFEAEVLGRNMDCGEFQIRFTRDLDKVFEIIGGTPSDIYIARNLPEDLKTQGLIITLNFRKIKDSEVGICTTYGPGYLWLYVTYAKLK